MIAMLPQRTRVFRPRPQLAAVQLAQVTIFLDRDLPSADRSEVSIQFLRLCRPCSGQGNHRDQPITQCHTVGHLFV